MVTRMAEQDGTPLDAVDESTEANEADTAEQQAEVDPDPRRGPPQSIPDEANEADASEQAIEVGLDEDDYR